MWCPCGTDQKFGIFIIFRFRASPRDAMPSALRLPRRCAPRNDTKNGRFFAKTCHFYFRNVWDSSRGDAAWRPSGALYHAAARPYILSIYRTTKPRILLSRASLRRRTWPTGSFRCEAPAAAAYFLPQSGRTRVASESSRRTRVASECSGSQGAASEPCGALCGSSGATRRTRVASVTPCGAFGSSGRARGIMRVSSKDAGCQAGSRSAS